MTDLKLLNELGGTLDQQVFMLKDMIRKPPHHAPKMVISPDLAQWILENLNNDNRPEKRKVLDLINRHGYRFIGGILLFGTGGGLLDGQNRLTACVSSQQPMETYVGFGVLDESFKFIDSGAKRQPGDAFAVKKVPYYNIHANAVRWIYNYYNPNEDGSPRRDSYDSATIYEYYRDKVNVKRLGHCVQEVAKHAPRIIPSGPLSAYLYLFSTHGEHAKAVKFIMDMTGRPKAKVKSLTNKLDTVKRNKMHRASDIATNAWIIQAISGKLPNWDDEKPYPTVERE
jgi:hypothetical protein